MQQVIRTTTAFRHTSDQVPDPRKRREAEELLAELRATLHELFPEYTDTELEGALAHLLVHARHAKGLPDSPTLKQLVARAFPRKQEP